MPIASSATTPPRPLPAEIYNRGTGRTGKTVPDANKRSTHETIHQLTQQKTSSQVHKNERIPSLASRNADEMWVDISNQRLPNTRLGSLYPGSRFVGIQECGTNRYEVVVDIQHVDVSESMITGYLNIKGLTTEFPELTTFFEGEIIGPKYSFLTRKWQAQQRIDVAHWKRFPSFHSYIDIFNRDDFVYDPTDKDYVYMRWKEHFLVPDHRVSNIDGASFAGFYYICYRRSTNEITGYYFFRHHTDWYQEIKLKQENQRCFGNFEFR
ncbi:vacuolar import and degradation protein-domain-containing protein [Phascolomyces articulosus]|uniref:Vacuolar import and degradation protein-domain-containing protein n=1 Tax=Phascolomyces articulosus TaxID=60185 RepID=A0AAD5K5E0_9FUNG|nr:vacuolar import and degradation protein-domain-containing protein [Phascolomyces articulosus]